MNQLPQLAPQLTQEEYKGYVEPAPKGTDEKYGKLLISNEDEAKVSALMSPHIISLNHGPFKFNENHVVQVPSFQQSIDYDDKNDGAAGQGHVDVRSSGASTVLIQNAIMKLKDMEEISEDIGSEVKDKMECDITSPKLITNDNTTTPKNSSNIMRFPQTHKTPGVIEIITPGQTPEVGGGLFECGKFPDSSNKGKQIFNSSISMRNIDFTCEKDYIPVCNQLYSEESVHTNEKHRPMTILENPYSPMAPSETQD